MLQVLLLALLLAATLPGQPMPPIVTASWQGASVVVTWSQPGNLYRHGADGVSTRLGRYEAAGELRLPDGPDDARHPMGGDVYILKDFVTGQVLGSAMLERPQVILPQIVKPPG